MREIRSLRAMWRGAGNQLTVWLVRHSQRKRGATDRPDLRSTGASPRPYRANEAGPCRRLMIKIDSCWKPSFGASLSSMAFATKIYKNCCI